MGTINGAFGLVVLLIVLLINALIALKISTKLTYKLCKHERFARKFADDSKLDPRWERVIQVGDKQEETA